MCVLKKKSACALWVINSDFNPKINKNVKEKYMGAKMIAESDYFCSWFMISPTFIIN